MEPFKKQPSETPESTFRIINLIEDTPGRDGCVYEHGLSFYIETSRHKLLIDTGATGAFTKNAQAMGIDLTQVDTVILSHGHYDHGGGIPAFIIQNPHARIYIRSSAFDLYYHKNERMEKYIGLDQEQLPHLAQVIRVEGNLQIDEELFLFTNVTGRKLWPAGNLELKRKTGETFEQDDMGHEQYLVVSVGKKKILLSGCAHNGILNIMDTCQKLIGQVPDVVVSGFHMMNKWGYSDKDLATIRQTAEELKQQNTLFFTGHCTGLEPFQILKDIMGDQITYIHSGETITLKI